MSAHQYTWIRRLRNFIDVHLQVPISGNIDVKDSQDVNIGGGISSRNRGPNWIMIGIIAATIVLVTALMYGINPFGGK